MPLLLNSFYYFSHEIRFQPQTYMVEVRTRSCKRNKHYHMKVLLNSFHLNGHTLGFYLQTLKSWNHHVLHNELYQYRWSYYVK